ncbi:unnamed protein product [Polarella glacialis]|uniref:Uncharacterized protein n=1 Tax=Polarella glacialis TaxID=89957 RepID=A0A813M1P5_POLGL|nr:unnamed protein product [Polarella glacialis]|mmetsp:Transcript_23731/g.38072  ORF Transcript_23731/g.38072 Transcript_23731/m.38072 type:complete len:480 (-) Transcript_23731:207-1646(-)
MTMASPGAAPPLRRRRPCLWLGLGASAIVLLRAPALSVDDLNSHRRSCPGTCALLPAPFSKQIARTPSTSSDRWPTTASTVSILQEPVERPLRRYLYKEDKFYNRIVPDWPLQYKTAEQQYFYKGQFSVFVMELTEEGAIVQDITSGIIGFVPEVKFGSHFDDLVPGATVNGARCTKMDNTVVQSPDLTLLRLQTGIVYEWDSASGEGYIIPSQGQDAYQMIRVLRRDIDWHDSRQLFPGQFVQFETALPEEVPVEANDDPNAPFALRVRSPEVRFTLEDSYELLLPGAEPWEEAIGTESSPEAFLGSGDEDISLSSEVSSGELAKQAAAYPVAPGRPEVQQRRAHPVLARFAQEAPVVAQAESPSWLWEPQLTYLKEERYDPIMPLKLRQMAVPQKMERILIHEVAVQKGDDWKEPAMRNGTIAFNQQKPPGRAQTEKYSRTLLEKRIAMMKSEGRQRKLRLANFQKEQRTRPEPKVF